MNVNIFAISLLLALSVAPAFAKYNPKLKKTQWKRYKPDSACYHVKVNFQWQEDCPLPNGAKEHFSPVIGCTHAQRNPFVQVGSVASKGVEDVAEIGDPTTLIKSIKNLVNCGLCHKQIGPYDAVNSPGELEFEVTVNRKNPHVSFISMIAPSPDWFTGVLNVDLRDGDYDWKESGLYNLGKYDAGTEEGFDFKTDNLPTYPTEPVGPIVDREIGVIGNVEFTRIDCHY